MSKFHFYTKIIPTGLIILFFVVSFYLSFKKTENKPSLNILTYSSFAGVYGSGRKLQKEFEAHCDCRVRWILATDSTHMLQRLKLDIPVDIVLGFDQIILKDFNKLKWKSLNLDNHYFVPEVIAYKTKYIVPINWSPIGFIYRSSELQLVQDMKEDLVIPKKISFPEPKTSTLGLQFYYWIYFSFSGNHHLITRFLKKLKKKVYGTFFSWSLSYGFFQKKRVDMSLSYLTSLAYHHEESISYSFSYSKKGHPYQVELAGIPEDCINCKLASNFLNFLITKKSQRTIMKSHFMFPSIKGVSNALFSSLRKPSLISYEKLPNFLNEKERLLRLWQETFY